MPKRIISVFGPRYSGKTTVSSELAERLPGAVVLDCQHPETWDDPLWSIELQAGVAADDFQAGDLRLEHLERVYRMVGNKLRDNDMLVLDGDTLATNIAETGSIAGPDMLGLFAGVLVTAATTQLGQAANGLYVHTTVSGPNYQERAKSLAARAPESDGPVFGLEWVDEGPELIKAYDHTMDYFEQASVPVWLVQTDNPYDPDLLAAAIDRASYLS